MKYKESRWEIKKIDDMWRATLFFTSTYGTRGFIYNEFDTEYEALICVLGWA